jgi:hypothetical protein
MAETKVPISDNDTHATVTTLIISMGSGAMARYLLLRHGFWCTVVVGFAALLLIIIGVAADLRFSILGLMLIFLVLPMLLAFVYFKHGLTLENALNILPHTLTFSEKGITIQTYKRKESEPNEASPLPRDNKTDDKDTTKSARANQKPEYIKDRCYHYDKELIAGTESDGNGVYFIIKGRDNHHCGNILLPYSALSPEAYKQAIKIVHRL